MMKKVTFFPMPPSTKINDNESAFYALVRWLEKEQKFECFFLTGVEAKQENNRKDRGEINERERQINS